MNENVDLKIKSLLKELSEAHARSSKFSATTPLDPTSPMVPIDIFEMALAYESEQRILMDLELAYSEKFPERYSHEEVEQITVERDRLTSRIRAWQNRQFPGQSREQ